MPQIATLLALTLVSAAQAAVTITEVQVDGRPAVVMENGYLKATVEPEKGGQLTGLLFKPTGKQLLLANEGSLLGSRLWNYADRELYHQWQQIAWEHKAERGPKQVRLEMRAPGKIGFTRSTVLVKRLTLDEDEAMLRVEHTLHVGQELMVPQKIGLWFANRCGVVGEQNSYFFPLDDGTVAVAPAGGASQEWFYNPARGWTAAVGSSGTGLAFNMEYRRLMCFYLCAGRQPTLEWAFRTFDVANGGSLRTEERIIPFAGLGRVHGSNQGVVVGFEAAEKCSPAEAQKGLPAKAVLAAGCRQSGDLIVELRRLPDGPSQEILRRALDLQPARPVAVEFPLQMTPEGTWAVTGRLARGGKELVDFTAAVVVGAPSGPVRVAAKEDRIGRPTERFEDQVPLRGTAPKDVELSMAVESDHVKWARPYHRGPLKVMVLTSCLNARESVELAQRLDMEILHVTAGTEGELGACSGIFGRGKSFKVEHTNQYIQEQLARPCDAILIGGLRGDLFTPAVLDLLRRKVEAGVGLVYAGPNNLPDTLASLLPLGKLVHPRRRAGVWRAARPHFLTTGVPLEELPATDYAEFRATGDPLATIGARGSAPLLVAEEGPGKGRVVVLTYNTGWQGSGAWKCGITPWISKADQRFKYWEYHFSLLAKSLLWTARREPPLSLEEIRVDTSAGAPKLVARFAAAATTVAESPVQAEVRVSDAYGLVEHQHTLPTSLDKDHPVFQVALPDSLPGGLHLADVIFKSRGKVVTWGSAPFRLDRGALITRLSFDKRCYRDGDTVRLAVEGKATDVTVRVELTDSLGRLLWQVEKKQASMAEGSPAEFAFALRRPLATVLKARVVLVGRGSPGGRTLAAAESDCITLPERFANRAWDDWQSCVWGNAAGAYEREYMVPLRARMYREYGITTVLAAAQWMLPGEFEANVRAGFQIMPMSVGYGLLNVGHRAPKGKIPFEQARTEYQKTHDKKYLLRPVCLNDPADLAETGERLRKLAEYCAWLEPIGYNLGDEMGTTHYVTPFDYDFGPRCLDALRDWLRGRYGSLDALNRQWETQFASWEAVVPMTAYEVKDRTNYSPWADHREFMDVTFANFFRWVRDRLREKDPRAGVGLSGSQAAEAYGGYDWSRLMATLDFMQSYTHQDTMFMHRSFDGRMPRAPWYGYQTVNPQMRRFLWQCLLNGNQGGSYFVDGYLFRPDYTRTESTRDAFEVVSRFQQGLAKLLRQTERVNDVGIHYSHPSIRGAFVTGADALFRDNRGGWVTSIQDAGLQCEFLSTSQLEAGELAKRGYRAFVLPYSVAITSKEAAALRQYVAAGGVLLADAKPALMDAHCRTLAAGQLDELFGVTRPRVDASAASCPAEVRLARDLGACKLAGLNLDVSIAEPELKATDGTRLAEHGRTPLLVVKRHGKGTAVLLNFFLDGYARRRELHLDRPLRQLVENLLRLARLEPEVRVLCSAGEPGQPGTVPVFAQRKRDCPLSDARFYIVRFRSGRAQYVAVQYDATEKQSEAVQGSVTLPASRCVHDVLAGKTLGPSTRTEATIAPGDTKVYALLPYQVRGVRVRCVQDRVAPGGTIRYQVEVDADGEPGMHVFAVEVVGPDGKPRAHYADKLAGRQGSASGEIPLAVNDAGGAWTVRAVDVATKKAGTAGFVVGQ